MSENRLNSLTKEKINNIIANNWVGIFLSAHLLESSSIALHFTRNVEIHFIYTPFYFANCASDYFLKYWHIHEAIISKQIYINDMPVSF